MVSPLSHPSSCFVTCWHDSIFPVMICSLLVLQYGASRCMTSAASHFKDGSSCFIELSSYVIATSNCLPRHTTISVYTFAFLWILPESEPMTCMLSYMCINHLAKLTILRLASEYVVTVAVTACYFTAQLSWWLHFAHLHTLSLLHSSESCIIQAYLSVLRLNVLCQSVEYLV